MRRVASTGCLIIALGVAMTLGLPAGFIYGYARQHVRDWAPPVLIDKMHALETRLRGGTSLPELPSNLWHPCAYDVESERTGVVAWDQARASSGLTLCLSADAPAATLVDLDGIVRHSWRRDLVAPTGGAYWQHAEVEPNGDLLVLQSGAGLARLDRDANILWRYDGPCRHDFACDSAGRIYTLAAERRVIPRVHETHPVVEDFVVVLDAQGVEQAKVSLLDCFEHSDYASVLARMGCWNELLFPNTIRVLRSGGEAFGGGDVLVSLWMLDTVAAVDLDAGRVVWALSGMWTRQRDVNVLEDNRLLIAETRFDAGQYRFLELDPVTQQLSWTCDRTAPGIRLGHENVRCQRLPNGNTLVTECDNGRVVELTPEGEVVWEFRNPHRAGPGDTWVALLMQATRLPADFPRAWLDANGGSEEVADGR